MKNALADIFVVLMTALITVEASALSAGPDKLVGLDAGEAKAMLEGSSSEPTMTLEWSFSGPAAVSFYPDKFNWTPEVTFTIPGTYVFTVEDESNQTDKMTVTVFQEPLSPGLIGHWPLNGNAYDSTTYGNDGIEHGSLQYVPGKVGLAVKFDGKSGIKVPNEWFFETLSPEMTVSFWAKISHGTHPEGVVVGKKDFSLLDDKGRAIGIGWSLDSDAALRDNQIGWFTNLRHSPPWSGGVWTWGIRAGSYAKHERLDNYKSFHDGKWRHYAAVTTAVGDVILYIDGKLSAIASELHPQAPLVTTERIMNDTPVTFGYSASAPGARNWVGYLDEVRIYNVALTQQDILNQIAADDGTCEELVAGDINGDCVVDINDFALFADQWLSDCEYPNCID